MQKSKCPKTALSWVFTERVINAHIRSLMLTCTTFDLTTLLVDVESNITQMLVLVD